MENKIDLNAGQLSRLRDLVNDQQDRLFDKLELNVKAGREVRAQALMESLQFWDKIDYALRDARAAADFQEQKIASQI